MFPYFDPVVASSIRVRLDLDTRKRVWPSAPVYLDFDDRRGHPSFLRFRPWEEDTALHPLSPRFPLHEPLLPLNFDTWRRVQPSSTLHPFLICVAFTQYSVILMYISTNLKYFGGQLWVSTSTGRFSAVPCPLYCQAEGIILEISKLDVDITLYYDIMHLVPMLHRRTVVECIPEVGSIFLGVYRQKQELLMHIGKTRAIDTVHLSHMLRPQPNFLYR